MVRGVWFLEMTVLGQDEALALPRLVGAHALWTNRFSTS